VTDTGWGCMIRVGQMLYAEILKTFIKPLESSELLEVCNYFSDFNKTAIFSIQNIAKYGSKEFNLKPG
jgi:hypothetical protein